MVEVCALFCYFLDNRCMYMAHAYCVVAVVENCVLALEY